MMTPYEDRRLPLSKRRKALSLAERIVVARSTARRAASGGVDEMPPNDVRFEHWRSQFPFADGDFFAQRLAAFGTTELEFRHALSDNNIAESEISNFGFGDWASVLERIYTSLTPAPPADAVVPSATELSPFLRMVAPVLDHFVDRLVAVAVDIQRRDIAPPFDTTFVPRLFSGSLVARFQRMLTPVLVLKLNLLRIQGNLAGDTAADRYQDFLHQLTDSDFAMGVFCEFPVLARQILSFGEQWLTNCTEFLSCLSQDQRLLETMFSPEGELGDLIELKGQIGDSHCGGRCVQIAVFRSGVQIVYKPRSLAVDSHFQEFLHWINDRADHTLFKPLTVLDQGKYGWVEHVNPCDCSNRAMVVEYDQRLGGLLALFYLLSGTDLHCDNVLACGAHPVLVDVETLFHPRLGTQERGIATDHLASSVLQSGLLPLPLRFGDGARQIDRSGLGATRSEISPLALLCPEKLGTDELHLVRKNLPIRPSMHRPTLQGEPVDLIDADAFVRGFEEVYRLLLRHKHGLFAQDGPIARFLNDEVRIVLRNTIVYSRMLTESYHPDVLRDALDRDRERKISGEMGNNSEGVLNINLPKALETW